VWHILYGRLLLFLIIIGNRFLKTGSKSSLTSVIGEPTIDIAAMGTGESATGSASRKMVLRPSEWAHRPASPQVVSLEVPCSP
jgi:hypothetical protein